MKRNNRTPDEGMNQNNRDIYYGDEINGSGRGKNHQIDGHMFLEDYPSGRKAVKKSGRYKKRSLFMEYVHAWYVFLITLLVCAPAYMTEIFLGSLFVAKNVPPMVAALLTMFFGGFIATLPLLVLNIYLIAKKKKYYAIAVQIIAIELLGLLFFLCSKIAFTWA